MKIPSQDQHHQQYSLSKQPDVRDIIAAMEKQTRQIKVEHLFYFLVFGIAFGFRLLRVGDGALSDFEAGWAVESWKAVQGYPYQIVGNPGYFSLTSFIFYLFGSTNGLARFWPALAGSLFVLSPLGLRPILGPRPALIMAFGLALDPGMVAVSHLAGGPMLAIGSCILMMVFLVSGKPIMTGIMGGLALISGTGIWVGLVGLLITVGLARIAGVHPVIRLKPGTDGNEPPPSWSKEQTQLVLVIGAATGLLTATLFFRFPAGLGAWGNSITQYLNGWIKPSGTPVMQPIIAVLIYQPLVIFTATIASVRGWRNTNNVVRWLSIWAVTSLVLTLVYPGRQVYDSAWALVPLWALAALELSHYLKIPEYPIVALGQAGIVTFLLILFWLISMNPIPGNFSWAVLSSLPILIIMTAALVGLGWSWNTSRSGFIWGIGLTFGLYSFAAMVGVSQLRPNNPKEIWYPPTGVGQNKLFSDTLHELALINNGRDDWIDIVSELDRPSLQWELRNFSDVRYVATIGPEVMASIILTPANSEGDSTETDGPLLSQSMGYRGQDFTWSIKPGWPGALPSKWWEWVTMRQAPIEQERIILWARSDLFPEQILLEQGDSARTPIENLDDVQQDSSIE